MNREHKRAYDKARYSSKREELLKQVQSYRRNNRDKINSSNAQYRAAKRNATPSWVNLDTIDEIYSKASRLREEGQDVHVDHRVPLCSDLVCGLHIHDNLEIIPAVENISKHNKYWEHMW